MKKLFYLFFFTALITIMSFQITCYASTQSPALWPAIYDIKTANDGGYIFTVKVRAYCPEGIEGNLLVAAYDDTNRLLDVKDCGFITISPFELAGNCPKADFLEKTSLTTDQENTLSVDLELEDKNKAIIKAFVIEFDTLKPEIESGKIEYYYNNGESYVDVDYTLESNHYNHVNGDYYYYYYYDGQSSRIEFSLDENFYVGTQSSFYFCYYHTFDSSTGIYENNSLNSSMLSYGGFSGVKIRNYIKTSSETILNRYGFKTENIRIYI